MSYTLISIEGNIGAGKSTFVHMLREAFAGREDVTFLQEPVEEWEKVTDGNGDTILAKFYRDPRSYSFPFQMLAFITRVSMLRAAIRANPHGVIITERCLDADRRIFATMLRDAELMEPPLFEIYRRCSAEFDDLWRTRRHLRIYLRASPEKCLARVQRRRRAGEVLDLAYLTRCHQYHDAWLVGEDGVLVLDADVDREAVVREYGEWVERVRQELAKIAP